MKRANLLILGLVFVMVGVTFIQVDAAPSPGLRVIVIDPEAGGFAESLVRSVNPNLPSNNVIPINNEGTLNDGENIDTYNGDVYVANVDRISRLNLFPNGTADPPLDVGDNVEDITDADFSSLTGIAITAGGLAYVSDSFDNEIYTVDLTDAPLVSRSLLAIDHTFLSIRDIALENNNLFILDVDVAGSGDDGRIIKIDLGAAPTQDGLPAVEIYSGAIGTYSLSNARNIAVNNGIVYVSGNFVFGAGIISIDSNLLAPTATIFSNNLGGQLSIPNGLAIDTVGNDLYVADDNAVGSDVPTIYRFSLSDPIPVSPTFVATDLLAAPVGLALLVVEESTLETNLAVTKEVDNPTPLPLEHIFYTITVRNDGPDVASSLFVRDVLPNLVDQTNPLSYTTEFHDFSTGQVTQGVGICTFLITSHAVECQGFGSLDVNDFVVITIEGIVQPGAQGSIRNEVIAINEIFSATAFVDITVSPSVMFSTLTKDASFLPPIVAGDSTIDYEITIENATPLTANALNVVVIDSLPKGVTIDQDTIPAECQVIENPDGSSKLECSYTSIDNGNGVTIPYTISVDAGAPNPLINIVTVTCDNCELGQTTSTETEVLKQSDLSIEKMADKTEVVAGQDSIQYTVTITNHGPSDADNVVITDILPDGVTLSAVSGCDDYSLQDNILTCNVSSIPATGEPQNVDITVDVNSNAVGQLENTVTVTSDSEESAPDDNEAVADPIDVIQLADVTITKTGPATTIAGRTITYEFTVTNIGSSDAEEVLVSDELPSGFTLIPSTEAGSLTDPMCQDQLGTVECQFGTVGAGQTITKIIQVQIALDVTGNIENIVTVGTSTEESDSDNNISTITTFVEPPFCGRAESDFDNIITGTPGNDHIKGTNGDDLIFGLGGNDKIHGKNGNDCIIGGDGDDKIWGGKGDDGIEGNAGNDKIHGQQGNDTLTGGDGDDKIYGGQGDDIIDAGSGNDRVHANQGNDVVMGGDGNDWLGAGNGNDEVSGGQGNDKIFGRQGNDILNGDDGDDYIHGGQGNDTVNGGNGNDKIFGQQGHDTLNGNDNDDYIHGGQGNDDIDGGDGYDKCNGAQGNNEITNCEVEDKKMKEEHEENDDDEGESEDDDDDHDEDDD